MSNLDTRVDKLRFFEFNFRIFVISSQKYLQLKFMKIEITRKFLKILIKNDAELILFMGGKQV